MSFKPGDLFFGLMDFLAFIVPGFILCVTLPAIVNYPTDVLDRLTTKDINAFVWVSFFLISYIAGHFIHHLCALILNPTYQVLYLKRKLKKHKSFVGVSEEMIAKKFPLHTDTSKAAEAYLRLHYSLIVPELEKNEANAKLFRSLCLLSLYLCFFPGLDWKVIVSLIIVAILSFVKFANQRWTHRFLVYQYFLLTTDNSHKDVISE